MFVHCVRRYINQLFVFYNTKKIGWHPIGERYVWMCGCVCVLWCLCSVCQWIKKIIYYMRRNDGSTQSHTTDALITFTLNNKLHKCFVGINNNLLITQEETLIYQNIRSWILWIKYVKPKDLYTFFFFVSHIGIKTYRFRNLVPCLFQTKHGCVRKCCTHLQDTIEIVKTTANVGYCCPFLNSSDTGRHVTSENF